MAQLIAAPFDVSCPVCQSIAGQACTQPTHTGRRPVSWFHSARADAYREALARGEVS